MLFEAAGFAVFGVTVGWFVVVFVFSVGRGVEEVLATSLAVVVEGKLLFDKYADLSSFFNIGFKVVVVCVVVGNVEPDVVAGVVFRQVATITSVEMHRSIRETFEANEIEVECIAVIRKLCT